MSNIGEGANTGVNGGGASRPEEIYLAKKKRQLDWKRSFFIFLGLALFLGFYFFPYPHFDSAIDPQGHGAPLTHEGKAAIGLFLLATVWWMFEVVPIGVTAIAVGVIQALFLIREPEAAFGNFFHPAVWFILGSLTIGLAFTKTGLTRRISYKMLTLAGEKTRLIYLWCFLMIAVSTLAMAHTTVAATVFPLLMAINTLYTEDDRPTKFGKGLFIGMAFSAGTGSVVTFLGSARAAVGVGFFKVITKGEDVSFFKLSYYLAPLGLAMTLIVWAMMTIMFPPEKKTIPGLKERAKELYAKLERMSRAEFKTLAIVIGMLVFLAVQPFIPSLAAVDKSAIILIATVLFFALNILTIHDLEDLPINIVLLFGGAMSIGYCLWETDAALWLGIKLLPLFEGMRGTTFVLLVAFFTLITANFIMNVAVIAIVLPVALVIAPYLHLAPEVVLYSVLASSGMPFLFLVGAAPNAIAYGSGQFSALRFFKAGVPASILMMIVLALFIYFIWPAMGMPVLLPINP